MCTAHRQTSEFLSREITAATSLSDVNLYLEGRDMYGSTYYIDGEGKEVPVYQGDSTDYRITNQKANVQVNKGEIFNLGESEILNEAEGPTKGQYVRMGINVDVSKDENSVLKITTSGEHANVRSFANDIIEALGSGEFDPDFIIISFDAWAWAYQSTKLDDEDDAKVMLQAAKLLERYYKENRVIWLT